MTDFDDSRIHKLPVWAQELIGRGRVAVTTAEHWRTKEAERTTELEMLKHRYAQERGAAEFDTWVSEGYDWETDRDIRFGLGTGRTVSFGDQKELTPNFGVTYRDGGLDIEVEGSDFVVKSRLAAKADGVSLRIEQS